MSACPDASKLLAVQEALEWHSDASLHHLATCDACNAVLDDLRDLHDAAAPIMPEAHVMARITSSLRQREVSEQRRSAKSERRMSLAPTFVFVCVTLCVWQARVYASQAAQASGGATQTPGGILLVAAAAGLMVVHRVKRAAAGAYIDPVRSPG